MLRELRIENLALIRELRLAFHGGLAVFTGETGAGKSIVLQAVGLLSGGRASASWVRAGAEQAVVEALFELPENPALRTSLAGMGIEADGELVIRRVLEADGRSRFSANGNLCTAKQIAAAAEHLVSIASQHDHQLLLQPRHHLDCIDTAGGLWPLRQEFAALFKEWLAAEAMLHETRQREQGREQRLDFLRFQLKEITEAAPREGEDEELEMKKKRLQGAEELRTLGGGSAEAILQHLPALLGQVRRDLDRMAAIDPSLAGLASNVAEQSFLLEDHGREIQRYVDALPDDADRLDEVTARIDLLQRLKRKYGPTLGEMLRQAEEARAELDSLETLGQDLETLSERCRALGQATKAKAAALSAARTRAAAALAEKIEAELSSLGFHGARFGIRLDRRQGDDSPEGLGSSGADRAEFLFSANPGEALLPLAKIASGGELSRLMLALRCVLARQDVVETVIFDEVDAGIGGKAAEAVAKKIRELASHHQVMCITHLPQIASAGVEHFCVEKRQDEGRTITEIRRLSPEGRVHELARMLDGDSATAQTLAFAADLIGRNAAPRKVEP